MTTIYPNGAGVMDYEDVGLQLNDQVTRVELSECCDYKVTCISRTCLKCLKKADTYYKYFIETENGSEEVIY